MSDRTVNSISGRLSLREPQRRSLEILSRITEIVQPGKTVDVQNTLTTIRSEYPTVTDFERDFPSLCFALATGVGKTRLMGAFIAYLYLSKGIRHFFVLAPNLTIYNKLIADFTPNTSKYVFKGIAEFAQDAPLIITGDNYESGIGVRGGQLFDSSVHVNIFNISKINSEVRGGKSPRIKRLSEYIGQSYFDYLSSLPDLVLIMDESHRYRASAGVKAINDLKPILGLELTATPFTESGTQQPVPFKNVIYDFPLSKAMDAGFVKEPAVVTQKNFRPEEFSPDQLERIKLQDGIRLHENTKVELQTYARNSGVKTVKPFMLVVARDTTHAASLVELMKSDTFFEGRYRDRVIQVDSSTKGAEESEEIVARLLSIEDPEEPTEIVVHVNMLKEGWDVTNLYTIVPLRAANARTLVEQSIGRGLRLPYGKRTSVSAVDRLNIVAHDKFQEIVDEANRADSPLRLTQVILDPDGGETRLRSVPIEPNVTGAILGNSEGEVQAMPLGQVSQELRRPQSRPVVEATLAAIRNHEHAPTSYDLLSEKNQESIILEVAEKVLGLQPDLPGAKLGIDIPKVVRSVTEAFVENTIDIPRIQVLPKGDVTTGFSSFSLDCSSVRYQPVERDILIRHLHSHAEETLSSRGGSVEERRLEDYLVRALIDYDDVSYDDHADLLYNLSTQMIDHLYSYLSGEDEVKNVLVYHQRQLAGFIHAQMIAHRWEQTVEYEVVVAKGFTQLKGGATTMLAHESIRNFRQTVEEKDRIAQYLFGGFSHCLYSSQKFQSDTERRFAIILDRDSRKWFRPMKGQFQIFYRIGIDIREYVPDFAAETSDGFLIIETKAKRDMDDVEVAAKCESAVRWCAHASEHNRSNSRGPWKYLFIPHDAVADNMTLGALSKEFVIELEGAT